MSEPVKIEPADQATPAEPGCLSTSSRLVNEVRSQGRLFVLNRPLRVAVTHLADGWCYEVKALAILAFGRSEQEAHDSFSEDFAVLWDAIAQAPDESLTGDAIAVKHAFQQLVGTVVRE